MLNVNLNCEYFDYDGGDCCPNSCYMNCHYGNNDGSCDYNCQSTNQHHINLGTARFYDSYENDLLSTLVSFNCKDPEDDSEQGELATYGACGEDSGPGDQCSGDPDGQGAPWCAFGTCFCDCNNHCLPINLGIFSDGICTNREYWEETHFEDDPWPYGLDYNLNCPEWSCDFFNCPNCFENSSEELQCGRTSSVGSPCTIGLDNTSWNLNENLDDGFCDCSYRCIGKDWLELTGFVGDLGPGDRTCGLISGYGNGKCDGSMMSSGQMTEDGPDYESWNPTDPYSVLTGTASAGLTYYMGNNFFDCTAYGDLYANGSLVCENCWPCIEFEGQVVPDDPQQMLSQFFISTDGCPPDSPECNGGLPSTDGLYTNLGSNIECADGENCFGGNKVGFDFTSATINGDTVATDQKLGAITPNLNCQEFNYDCGDCCPDGCIRDCADRCVPFGWLCDGICDDGSQIETESNWCDVSYDTPNFNCSNYGYDCGDCYSEASGVPVDFEETALLTQGDGNPSCNGIAIAEFLPVGDFVCDDYLGGDSSISFRKLCELDCVSDNAIHKYSDVVWEDEWDNPTIPWGGGSTSTDYGVDTEYTGESTWYTWMGEMGTSNLSEGILESCINKCMASRKRYIVNNKWEENESTTGWQVDPADFEDSPAEMKKKAFEKKESK